MSTTSNGKPQSQATVRLHSYFRSSASWRVRIGLAFKGIDYEYHPVHLLKDGGQQHSDSYRKLNPLRAVPTLEIDGLVLGESLAILEYLEETRPTPPLLPANPAARAQARQLAEVVNAGIQPVQNLRVLQHLEQDWGADQAAKAKWARHYIGRGLEALEALVVHSAGQCSVGDSVSIADLCLVPQLYNARRFAVEMERFPRLLEIEAHLKQLPAFQAAEPNRQPDCPPELLQDQERVAHSRKLSNLDSRSTLGGVEVE